MDIELIYLSLAIVAGFLMAWGIGANDVANAMGTAVGSKSITIKQAIVIAAIFEFLGAILGGAEVTNTLKERIVDPSFFSANPGVLVIGMLAALFATAIWLISASVFGWPVSTTHTIVGAIIGFGAVNVSIDAVQWGNVGYIMLSWLISPFLGAAISYTLFFSMQKFITKDIDSSLKKLMVISACIMAFAHGSNDVANAIGPVAAIMSSLTHNVSDIFNATNIWISVLGATGIVIGLASYGHKVITTIGNGITQLTPTSGFATTMATAITVLIASLSGMPISTTHTVVGAILGVGLARGIAAINLNAIRSIFLSWFITMPIGAVLAAIIFTILRTII